MAATNHKVAGVYKELDQANAAVEMLREAGFEASIADRENWKSVLADPAEVEERLKDTVATGVGAGAGLGAAGSGALLAAEVAVVAASPVLALLAGAGLGAIAGTAVVGVSSSSVREPLFQDLVREAVEDRENVVVVARTESEAASLEAQSIISRSAADSSIDQHGGQHQ